MNYTDLDLSLFSLKEGKPLALPWIEQEEHITEAMMEADHSPVQLFRCLKTVNRFRIFYQSPFDPSIHLVGEKALFVGFYRGIRKGNFVRWHSQDFGGLWIDIGRRKIEYRPGKTKAHVSHAKPKTLSHFINDCHRAGIELIWSPYAIKKLLGISEEGGEG